MIVVKNITNTDNNIYQVKKRNIQYFILYNTFSTHVFNATYRIFENVFSIVNEIMIS